jgi:hypothetical protein
MIAATWIRRVTAKQEVTVATQAFTLRTPVNDSDRDVTPKASSTRETGGVKFERGPRSVAVVHVKGVLSGVAAIFIALLGPGLLQALKDISGQQSTGLGAIAGGFWIPFFSPLFWILAVSSFVLFLTASRLGNKVLRVLLFWIPTLFVSALGFGLVALFTYGWMHFRKG